MKSCYSTIDAFYEEKICETILSLKSNLATISIPIEPNCFATLEQHLRITFQEICKNAIVLELDIAKRKNALFGGSPEERFSDFIRQLKTAENQRRFFEKYPMIDQHLKSIPLLHCIPEIVGQLQTDYLELQRTFFLAEKIESLFEIAILGETHKQGKAPCRLTFTTTEKKKIQCIYKPRSALFDEKIQKICKWIEEGTGIEFLHPQVIDKGGYSWHSFVEERVGEDPALYHTRLGAWLAIAYSLRGRDLHYENVVRHGNHPVFIDYECFFSPDVDGSDFTLFDCMILNYSPHFSSKIDLSALSGGGPQRSPTKAYRLLHDGTDQLTLHFDYEEIKRPPPPPAYPFRAPFIEGYEKLIRFFIKNRAVLLEKIAEFCHCFVRVVPRPTLIYDQILKLLAKPSICKSHSDTARFIDESLQKSSSNPLHAPFTASEKYDLALRDIPYFFTQVNSTILSDSRGNAIEGVLASSGIESVKKQIEEVIREEKLPYQMQLIHNSFDALCYREGGTILKRNIYRLKIDSPSAVQTTLNDHLEHIESLKVTIRGEVRFPTVIEQRNSNRWTALSTFSSDSFYDGAAGLSLLFLYAGLFIHSHYLDLSNQCLAPLEKYLEKPSLSLGFYSGVGGVLYLLGKHCEFNASKKSKAWMEKLIKLYLPQISTDQQFDVIYGTSGYLLALLNIEHLFPDNRLLGSSISRVIASLLQLDTEKMDSSFAHGLAGIVYALTRAYQREPKIEIRLWIDKACRSLESGSTLGWCRGKSGIEIAKAVATSTKPTQGSPDALDKEPYLSLCHGWMGVMDSWLVAKENGWISKDSYEELFGKAAILALSKEDLTHERGSIGLMSGTGGIAYQLLRHSFHSTKIPSILFV